MREANSCGGRNGHFTENERKSMAGFVREEGISDEEFGWRKKLIFYSTVSGCGA